MNLRERARVAKCPFHGPIMLESSRIVFLLMEAIERFFSQILNFHFLRISLSIASFSNLSLAPLLCFSS